MLFNSPEFLIFTIALLAVLSVTRGRWTHWALLLASYLFYGWWDWRFVGLLLFSTTVDYSVGRLLEHTANEVARRWVLGLSIATNVGLLAFFKYYGFLSGNLAAVFGHPVLPALHVILPIGISFFTFQSLSYTIDVYRRKLPAERSFLRFALFLAFFPQLISGPITRATEFLHQFRRAHRLSLMRASLGGQIFLTGFIKKTFVADRLAGFVDPVFAHPLAFDSPTALLATVGYALQIFCDFSGYSDMAIGVAIVFGYRLVQNFETPYRSLSITEFWRRWHQSLSRWLRDYLYIGLGGNRGNALRTRTNLMLTMLIGGLWHGASWNFVLWGGMHGAALVLDRSTPGVRGWLERQALGRVLLWGVTFAWVCLAWVLFRAPSFQRAAEMYSRLFRWSDQGTRWLAPEVIVLLVVAVIAHLIRERMGHRRYPTVNPGTLWGGFVIGAVLLIAMLGYPKSAQPFIYFQF